MQNSSTIQENLVKRARAGHNDARAELFRLYVNAAYHHCIRITGNKADAEDVLQDSFLYAFDHLHQVQNAAAFGGWLRRIVVANAIRCYKKNSKWSAFEEDPGLEAGDDAEPWWLNISMEAAHEAIRNLPNGCRQVFVLFVFEDFSHKEIAGALGISESTSKSQYQRARQLLKERLAQQKKAYG